MNRKYFSMLLNSIFNFCEIKLHIAVKPQIHFQIFLSKRSSKWTIWAIGHFNVDLKTNLNMTMIYVLW